MQHADAPILSIPKRLCVIAAHPDDDVIGCGGLMAKVLAGNGLVQVLYLTDGSRSHPGSTLFPPHVLAHIRADEARAGLQVLGCQQAAVFFGIEDGTLGELADAERREIVARLAESIAGSRPELVVAPWLRDPHPDHRAAAELSAEALTRISPTFPFAGYDVWLQIRGSAEDAPLREEVTTCVVTLDADERKKKRTAILAHRSQTTNLIDDAPEGFRIDAELLARWTSEREYFYLYASAMENDSKRVEHAYAIHHG